MAILHQQLDCWQGSCAESAAGAYEPQPSRAGPPRLTDDQLTKLLSPWLALQRRLDILEADGAALPPQEQEAGRRVQGRLATLRATFGGERIGGLIAAWVAKNNLVRISIRPLADLRPSPENDQLYRPASPDDADVQALARSIKDKGVLEPLVVSRDDYILSGHRRRVACQVAGVKDVPVRVENITRDDPRFLTVLREYNRQRVKTLDEVVREELVSCNPDAAYDVLVAHRQERSAVSVETIEIVGEKRRAAITKAKQPFLNAILKILEEYREFWPLTDRRIHYALLNDPPRRHASKPDSVYRNTVACYKDTCDLITRARLAGIIPFRAVYDPTRPVEAWNYPCSPGPFVRESLDDFLMGYRRDLQQSQPNHIEIIGEKNTVLNILLPVAETYCIPLTIGRGYASIPPRYEMVRRFRKSGKERLVVLAVSDFDPEGQDISHSFARSLRDDFGVRQVEPIQVALTAEQVEELDLPPAMQAKETSSRYRGFAARHGDEVHELEAVAPEDLQQILHDAIGDVMDFDAYDAEVAAEQKDAAYLTSLRKAILSQAKTVTPPEEENW
jgi:hypothetical protein